MDTACDIKVIQSGPKSETTLIVRIFNPLKGTVKPQSNGPLFSNTVIGTLAVDKWAVTFGTTRRGLGGLRRIPPRCTTASIPTSYYSMEKSRKLI